MVKASIAEKPEQSRKKGTYLLRHSMYVPEDVLRKEILELIRPMGIKLTVLLAILKKPNLYL